MIKFFLIFVLIHCQYLNLQGQLFDDFSDSDLTSNPIWSGDVSNFIVNASQQLQLNAPEGGTSILYSTINFPDSINWEFEFNLNFAPSANNKLRVYLALDQLDLSLASGYFIEVGENGNLDALNFYRLDAGVSELIASGAVSSLAEEPAYCKLKITYFPDGLWTIFTAYEIGLPLNEEISFYHNENNFEGDQFFQLECTYTASRTDKYSFDNISISPYELDKTGPEILSVSVLDAKTIKIQFNELLEPMASLQKSNFNIIDYAGQIINSELVEPGSAILLTLSQELLSGTNYSFEIHNVEDLFGNKNLPKTFEIFLLDDLTNGDIVINEILFNPETDGVDFVEILNISNKFISLQNLLISNTERNEVKSIAQNYILKPGKYLCLTQDIAYLKNHYSTPDTANFLFATIPGFNNESGNVSLINGINNETIDAFDYNESFHFAELEDLNGVSLERINPYAENQSSSNWFSAAAYTNYATPGYQNTIFLNPSFSGNEIIEFENKTFSPDQDGKDDFLIIKYNLPSTGYLADINVYDQAGRLVKTIVNNELLSTQGFVLWDGLNKDGEISNIGIYFIVFEAYNGKGNVITTKKPAILAHYLD